MNKFTKLILLTDRGILRSSILVTIFSPHIFVENFLHLLDLFLVSDFVSLQIRFNLLLAEYLQALSLVVHLVTF
jgi:hypothetical protein